MNDVERIFRTLVQVLTKGDPERMRAPIEISEIYQSILPYRHYRGVLEFETNQDYEMALLRFLSGEGGYASVDPAEAQEALEEEARGSHPNPGAFREYAAAKVYLNTRAARLVMEEPKDAPDPYAPPEEGSATQAMSPPFVPDTTLPGPMGAPSDHVSGAATFEQVTAPTPSDGFAPPPPSPVPAPPFLDMSPAKPDPIFTPAPTASEQCPHCQGRLPADRDVRFCPHCGNSTQTLLCGNCGSELETGWKFCVVCGKRSAPADE